MRRSTFIKKYRLTLFLHAKPHSESQTYINFLLKLETTLETRSLDIFCICGVAICPAAGTVLNRLNARQADVEFFFKLKKKHLQQKTPGGFEPWYSACQAIVITTAPLKAVDNYRTFLSIYHVTLTIIES